MIRRWLASSENGWNFLIYLVFGLIWLVAQIASWAANRRRRQSIRPHHASDGTTAAAETEVTDPPPVPSRGASSPFADELREFLSSLSGETRPASSPVPPQRSPPKKQRTPSRSVDAVVPSLGGLSPVVAKPPFPSDEATVGMRMDRSFLGALNTGLRIPGVRFPALPAGNVRAFGASGGILRKNVAARIGLKSQNELRRAFILKAALETPPGLEPHGRQF